MRIRVAEMVSAARDIVRTESGDTHASAVLAAAQLENRILLSASPLPVDASVMPSATDAEWHNTTAGGDTYRSFLPAREIVTRPTFDSADTIVTGASGNDRLAQPKATSREIVFLDADVTDVDQLMQDLLVQGQEARSLEIHQFDRHRDGIEQISEVLSRHDQIDALHIVSHGSGGALQLGDAWLNQQSLSAYAATLVQWQDAFASDADVLIYGCDLASTAEGQTLVEALSVLTGADVAASLDVTGHAAFGGDWDLEYTTGVVQAEIAFRQDVQQGWLGKLAVINVTQTEDRVNGNTTSVAALTAVGGDGGDGISLREAILAVNNDVGGDTIMLDPGTYTLDATSGGEDEQGDLDIRNDVTIVGASLNETVIDGNGTHRGFEIHDGGNYVVSISNLQIQNGFVGGSDALGGAIKINAAANSPTVSLNNVRLTHNRVSGSGSMGGAIYNQGTLTMRNSVVDTNSAFQGGAIYNASGPLSLSNVTLSGNTGITDGGGLAIEAGGAKLDFVTVASNSGGGIVEYSDVTINMSNSIVANNLGGNDISGSIDSAGNNIVGNVSGGSGFVGSDQQDTDPRLAPLGDYGGDTWTHALLADSPAIDAASAAGSPPMDQRGFSRDDSPDIGAFEFVAEILVNEVSIPQQVTGDMNGADRAVAMAGDGTYVVTWSSLNQDGSGWGVYARRFDITGTALTPELLVNQTIANDQQGAHVASATDGSFVVTWTNNQGTDFDIYARRYAADGTPLGGEFVVNTTTVGDQADADISMDGAGNFVISWEGNGTGDASGIFFRRFASTGVAMDASEQRANTLVAGTQQDAAVAMNAAGDFVLVWEDTGQTHFQLYDSNLIAGANGEVYPANLGSSLPDVGIDDAGNFVVTYRWDGAFGFGVWAHQFDNTGTETAPYWRVGPGTNFENKDHTVPSIAMTGDGDFMITYESVAEGGAGSTVFLERFSSDTTSLSRTQVNQTTTGNQQIASVAMMDRDNYVVVWSGNGDQTGGQDTAGVFARQYLASVANSPPTDISPAGFSVAESTNTTGGYALGTLTATDADVGETFTWSILPGGDAGLFSLGGGGNDELLLDDGVLDFTTKSSYTVNLRVGDSAGQTYDETLAVKVLREPSGGLWFSTIGAGDSSSLPAWGQAAIVELGGANLSMDTAGIPADTTSGSYAQVFDVANFDPGADVHALHYVGRDISIGGDMVPAFDLLEGDVLFSLKSVATLVSSNTLTVGKEDLAVFRPDVAGNYDVGSFFLLLDDFAGAELRSISLVEQDTVLPDTTLTAGTFLYSRSGGGEDQRVYSYVASDIGDGTTNGTSQVLIEGGDIEIDGKVFGIEFIEQSVTIGGTTLLPGQLLLTVDGVDEVGNNLLSVTRHDVFVLDVTQTSRGSGSTVATATLLLDGSDVELDVNTESLDAITLFPSNQAPTDIAPDQFGLDENTDTSGGYLLGTLVATDATVGETFVWSKLAGGDGVSFGLNAVTGELQFDDGVLDFETQSAYTVAVRVTDSAGHTYDETITLSVNDLNDNLPVVDPGQTLSVPELAPLGTTIGTATASDADGGTLFGNWTITGGNADGVFAIDVNTGTLQIADTANLNYEATSSYALLVTVDDGANTSAPQTITIQVSDENEAPTNITIDNLAVNENSAGATIGSLSTNDPDSGDAHSYTVNHVQFEVVSGVLQLKPGEYLDFETTPTVDLTVTAVDQGGLTRDQLFTLVVNDVIEAGIAVAVPGAQTVQENSVLVYSTAGGNAVTVSDGTAANPVLRAMVDVTNGVLDLATIAGLSFVSGDGTASIQVVGSENAINNALDGLTFTPVSGYSGPATLSVNADLQADLLGYYSFDNPANLALDESPLGGNDGITWGSPTSSFDAVRDSDVITFNGTDQAIVLPGNRFSTPTDLTLAAWVNVAAVNNQEVISLGSSIALRLNDNNNGAGVTGFYHDGGTWRHTDSLQFIGNDGWHHVAFTFDDATDTQVIYLDGVAVGTTSYVGSINWAHQSDTTIGSHANGTSYWLDGQVDDARIYDRALSDSEIQALAQDSHAAADTVSVTVNPTNAPPTVANPILDQAAIEGGAFNLTLAANTFDDVDGDPLTYAATQDDSSPLPAWLAFDGNTRTFSGTPAMTDVGSITVRVTADDGNGGSVFDDFVLQVLDTNDPPTGIAPSSFSIQENIDTSGGYSLGTLSAIDPDALDTFTYTIQGGVDAAAFSIGGVGGAELLLSDGMLDFETQDMYTVIVRVTDSGGGSHDALMTVHVTDVNEPPQLSLLNVVASIPEDADTSSSTKLADIVVQDDALGTGSIALGLVDAQHFSIVNGNELHLVAGASLDADTRPQLDLTVSVDDPTLGAGAEDTVAFTLTIVDVNESPVAVDDLFYADGSSTIAVPAGVLANDSDPEGDPLMVTIVTLPAHGTLSLQPDGSFTYIADEGYVGTDVFTYQIADGNSVPSQASVQLVVTGLAAPPATATSEPSVAADRDAPSERESTEESPSIDSAIGIGVPVQETSPKQRSSASATSNAADESGKSQDIEVSSYATAAAPESSARLALRSDSLPKNAMSLATSEIAIGGFLRLPSLPQAFIDSFDELRNDIRSDQWFTQAVVGSSLAVTTSFSVGYVIWLIRGGVLLSSVLSSLPAWQLVDPLPVLGFLNDDDDPEKDDDSLETLVAKSNATRKVQP